MIALSQAGFFVGWPRNAGPSKFPIKRAAPFY
jgi:hypothetical protein